MAGILGAAYLVGYLFFDGLVSTTQERVFGKNPSSSDPFGPESPVLDQMIWTNVFSASIAVAASVASTAVGDFWPNVKLLLTSPSLIWDVSVLSAASALGLIVLLNTIASFVSGSPASPPKWRKRLTTRAATQGALSSSLIMTVRQFLSILINAGIFGNFASVSLLGWTGVFWCVLSQFRSQLYRPAPALTLGPTIIRVASGIWIKINRNYDPPKQPRNTASSAAAAATSEGDEAKESLLLRTEHASIGNTLGEEVLAPPSPPVAYKQGALQSSA